MHRNRDAGRLVVPALCTVDLDELLPGALLETGDGHTAFRLWRFRRGKPSSVTKVETFSLLTCALHSSLAPT
jgi:hypothetical protein